MSRRSKGCRVEAEEPHDGGRGIIALVGLTAWQALVEKGQLKKGQKVFIQAKFGGVGCRVRHHPRGWRPRRDLVRDVD
jgi:NADPH-dependent curcumin reductase CurA